MVEGKKLATEAAAIELAGRLTGLDKLTSEIVARRLVLSTSSLPFLWREVVAKPAWEVTFFHAALKLKSAVPNFQDRYPREFTVVMLEDSGQLVSVTSLYKGEAPEMRAPASADSAQKQLQNDEEVYTGLPKDDPKIRFLDALDAILSKGSGSPFMAKAIEGVYVMESRMGSSPRAVWVITLRGLPPFSAHGPHADSVPIWQRNHMRNVVDAQTGDWLFATNSPQPQ